MDEELFQRLLDRSVRHDIQEGPAYPLYEEELKQLVYAVAEECARVCEALPAPLARDFERSDFARAIRAKFTA